MRRTIAGLVVALVVAVAVPLGAGPASAHNVLEHSDPADGSTIAAAPARASFTFGEPVQTSSYDTITVTGPGGTHWATSDVKVDGDTISAALGAFGPVGQYTIAYRIVSADGHPTGGQVMVTLSKAGSGSPLSAKAADPASTSSSGVPAWVYFLVVIAVLLAVTYVLRRHRGSARR